MDQPHTLQELRSHLPAYGDTAAIIAFAGDAEDTWSFAKLVEVSTRIATGLIRRGLARGDAVALIAPNSPAWIAAFWAIVAAGAVAVPLDPQIRGDDLARMLETAGCRRLFTTAAAAGRIAALAPLCRISILDSMEAGDERDARPELRDASPAAVFPLVAPQDTAVIVFTSGTTGTPKAVPLTHANLLANVGALATTRLVGLGDRALLPLPLYHAYPLTIGMLTPLALGCGIILPSGISGPELLKALREGRATALLGVPRLYTALLENIHRTIAAKARLVARSIALLLAVAAWAKRHRMSWPARILLRPLRRTLAPRLRLLVSGGAPISAEVEETLGWMGWEMLTGYGLVETASMLTFNPPRAALCGSAGKPVPGMEIRLANRGADGIGEIEVRGPSLFSGYRNDPEKTKEAFTPDGWFRTGDLGTIDHEGYLHIAARKSETIVLADGKKLFPEEFEAIYATAPLIREVGLLGQNGALVALVVPDLAAARDFGALRLEETIRDGLAGKARLLPSYARLSGFAIAREALPRTQLGKIRRHLLPPLYDAAQRHESAPAVAELSAEDRALLEQPEMARLWLWLKQRFPDKALQLDTIPQIDLAIDSLGWVELTLALERDFGIAMNESEIARIVTLRDLLRQAGKAQRVTKDATQSALETAWLEALPPWLAALRRIGEILLRLVMSRAFRLRIEGAALLPAADPVLFCPNHVSYLDPFALGAALPAKRLAHTCWGGWTGVAFTSRLRRLFSRAAHIIPVDPDRGVALSLAMASASLAGQWNLVWFPEGARSADGELHRFLPGIGALVAKNPVPIVPVYIEGTFKAWPVGRRFPQLRAITVRFGKPLDAPALLRAATGQNREEAIAALIRDAVAALATGPKASTD